MLPAGPNRMPHPRDARGHEQRFARYAVVVQANEFIGLGTVLVVPTSVSVRPASFCPVIAVDGRDTHVLVEQTTVVDPQRLGRSAGPLDANELTPSTTRSHSSSDFDASSGRSAGRTRTPTVCSAGTSPREPTSLAGAPTRSKP
jgi:mRNA interferase MazF